MVMQKTKMKTFDIVVLSYYYCYQILKSAHLSREGQIDFAEGMVTKRLGAIEWESSIDWFEFPCTRFHAISVHRVHPVPMRSAIPTQLSCPHAKPTVWNHYDPVVACTPGL